MMNKLLLIFIIIKFNIFCFEGAYEYVNIYNSPKYAFDYENYKIGTDILDLAYFKHNYKVDKIELNPVGLDIKLNTKYYDLLYKHWDLNFKDANISDEFVSFEEKPIEYIEYNFKIPCNNFESSIIYGENSSFDFLVSTEYGDFNIENLEMEKRGLGINNEKHNLFYKKLEINGLYVFNNVTPIGNLEGKIDEYSLVLENNQFSYRKIKFTTDIDVDNNTTYFLTSATNHYIYLDVNVDLDNYEYAYKYNKDFKKSKFSINNTLGILVNESNSSVVLRQIYYKDILSLFLLKIKEKTGEKEQELYLGKKYIYYDIINLNYEKYFGDFTLGINKLIPLTYNLDLKPNEVDDNKSETEDNSKNSKMDIFEDKEKFKEILFSGTKLYFKYEF